MRSTRGAFFALTVLSGFLIWRNRFAIQRQLEAMGVKTPMLKGSLGERSRSLASKVRGRFEHGVETTEQDLGGRQSASSY